MHTKFLYGSVVAVTICVMEEFSAIPTQEYGSSHRCGYTACLGRHGVDNTLENDCLVPGLW
jgi:hypothetical protein